MARTPTSSRARAEIEGVIARDEVMPVFQPIVDVRTGLVAGYEAMARFTQGRRRATQEWFEEAHVLGLGLQLEAHAAATALAVPRRPYGAFLSINTSGWALASRELRAALPERLDGIVLEVTGRLPGDDVLRAAGRDVRARGGQVAIKLAGSDYAGLRQLMLAAPDVLKLDRSLVHRIHADPAKTALVESMVRYGRNLGIALCAEGVEALDDLERLADLDVTYAQGFAIGRPTRPWAAVDPAAARVCTTSLAASVTGSSHPDRDRLDHDGRLQWLAWRLSEATSYEALAGAIDAIAAELDADAVTISVIEGAELVVVGASGPDRLEIRHAIDAYPETERLLREQDSVQILVQDPDADPDEVALMRELGFKSLLMLPVSCAGRAIGLFEAYSREGRPFSRFEIGRARIIALQVGAALERISRA